MTSVAQQAFYAGAGFNADTLERLIYVVLMGIIVVAALLLLMGLLDWFSPGEEKIITGLALLLAIMGVVTLGLHMYG